MCWPSTSVTCWCCWRCCWAPSTGAWRKPGEGPAGERAALLLRGGPHGGPGHAWLPRADAARSAGHAAQDGGNRRSGGAPGSYCATTTVTVLLITLGSGRCREVLHRVEALAVERRTAPLDVRATTLDELRTQGPWASIWRTLYGMCSPLDLAPVTAGNAVVGLGALSRTNAEKDR